MPLLLLLLATAADADCAVADDDTVDRDAVCGGGWIFPTKVAVSVAEEGAGGALAFLNPINGDQSVATEVADDGDAVLLAEFVFVFGFAVLEFVVEAKLLELDEP